MPRGAPPAQPPDFPHAKLLRWYRRHRRDLPWRPRPQNARTGQPSVVANPYHVLVSEAMAQQTQIATVLPYFSRFVEKFPTVQDLAAADEQAVLRLWQGLGYYSRARNLRKAARMIVDDFGGTVPRTVEELLQLPGVGRYTAGAIASVAFNVPAPIVDGNVARVLSRFDGIDTPINAPPTLKRLWARAEQLVTAAPSLSVGDFNQALMELGALVCTPKSPTCLVCPLRDGCVANATGRTDELPVKTPKKKPIEVTHLVLAIERRGKLLFEQRPSEGLWSNMWQLPTLELPPEARAKNPSPFGGGGRRSRSEEAATRNLTTKLTENKHGKQPPVALPASLRSAPLPEGGGLAAWARERFGLTVTAPAFVATFTHQTTHRTITFEVFHWEAPPGSGRLKPRSGQWRCPQRLDDLPLAKPQLSALQRLASAVSVPDQPGS